MTQEETPVGGEATAPAADPYEAFTEAWDNSVPLDAEQEEEDPAEQGEEPSLEADDDTVAEEEADDLPPIDAPVSWDAEAKEMFKNLPREAQEIVAKREGERERFVQQKSQEAVRAKTEAEQAAIQQLAEIEKGYSQHFQQIAQQIMPQAPDPRLLQHDPQAFYAQEYAFRQASAQQQELQQLAQQHAEQAQAREAQANQAYMAEQHRTIVEHFPEYADPTTGPKLRSELSAVAKEMGYTDDLIAQARANDILAMRKASEWKAKADQLDKLNGQKMEKVRAAKRLPRVATPGVPQGGDQVRANRATAAFEAAKSTRNRDQQGAAFFDYLKNAGHI